MNVTMPLDDNKPIHESKPPYRITNLLYRKPHTGLTVNQVVNLTVVLSHERVDSRSKVFVRLSYTTESLGRHSVVPFTIGVKMTERANDASIRDSAVPFVFFAITVADQHGGPPQHFTQTIELQPPMGFEFSSVTGARLQLSTQITASDGDDESGGLIGRDEDDEPICHPFPGDGDPVP